MIQIFLPGTKDQEKSPNWAELAVCRKIDQRVLRVFA
jgi:hypothetical protein